MLTQQSSAAKREVALKTLGQLASGTGYVMAPYMKYNKLLDVILTLMKTERLPSLRREVIKVLGILGAFDPHSDRVAGKVGLSNFEGCRRCAAPVEYQ